jgi:iron(III) transport system substrate-binding protein
MRKGWITLCSILVVFTMFVCRVQAQPTINTYMGWGSEVNSSANEKFFLEQTGTRIQYLNQSMGEVEVRVKAEAPNFNADMVMCVGAPLAFLAKKSGWVEPYVSPAWKGANTLFYDPQGYWYNQGNFSFVLVGNKDRLAKAGYKMPESWRDLLDPKWKGEILMASPLTSGTANLIRYTFLSLYGEKEGWAFLEALDKNIAFYTRSGSAPADLVARGEFMLGIAPTDNIMHLQKQGYPLIWSVPAEGTGYDGIFAFIFKGTKKLDLAKKIVDAIGTQPFSDLVAGIGYVTPRPAANPLFGKTPPKFIPINFEYVIEKKAEWNDIWKAKMREAAK